ncbi:hypothetical protein PV10_01384 [Exophiala mesophila]|uniref:Uncharacterized protein n=1 Tax=Exophiala mesophila TaxID=212818 RepID=A0A0D1ZSW8_EXOME|nr:uncharacterized protein PV10_01384 [Exophiala mesophila]KIV97667.1 hypothetical protein PV10_01384 [Exophiala mesophila]
MALLNISRIALTGLIGLGVASLHIFGESNGLFPTIVDFRTRGILPTHHTWTKSTFDTSITGFDPPDGLLATLLVFFWPLLDGENPAASLISIVFGGQAVAIWSVYVLEGWRKINQGRVISFTTIWGLVIQCIGYAVIGPLYLTIYLFTSPLVTSSAPLTPSALTIQEGNLSGLPFGIIIGFIFPSVLMALPTPSVLSLTSKITAILVWQAFPLWTTVYNYIWRFTLWPKIEYTKESDRLANQITILRNVYKFGLALSVPAHIATWTISLSTVAFPSLFTTAAQSELHPASVFLPPNPFGDAKSIDVAQGSKWFMQYDYAITSTAYVIWAIASRYSKSVKTATKDQSASLDALALVGILGKVALLGPFATALTLIWERDEIIFAQAGAVEEKKTS